jgi:hypothetical protein
MTSEELNLVDMDKDQLIRLIQVHRSHYAELNAETSRLRQQVEELELNNRGLAEMAMDAGNVAALRVEVRTLYNVIDRLGGRSHD